MVSFPAGRLDRRIVIEKNTPTRDIAGGEIDAWSTFATVWAQILPKRGRERFDANQVLADFDTIFRIRYRNDVTQTMRINYDGKLYDIQSMAEIGRRVGLEIMATANVE